MPETPLLPIWILSILACVASTLGAATATLVSEEAEETGAGIDVCMGVSLHAGIGNIEGEGANDTGEV